MDRYALSNIVQRYRESRTGRSVEALRVPRLDVEAGEILAVVGPNGSGKSTLLETMAFLQRPQTGQILLDGRDAWAERNPLAARRRCPILLQRTVLFKTTVLGNVMYGLRVRGLKRSAARRRAETVLRLVRLETLADRRHRELSGGERRRVALARLLALEPEILLLDEPTAHVDHANEHLIEEVIRDLHARTGMTVVLASHDARQAMALAGRVVTLVDGRLISGTMDNLFCGTLRRDSGGFTFRGTTGLVLRLPPETIALDEGETCPASETPVQIAIDTCRIQVIPVAEERNPADVSEHGDVVTGRIESIRQQQDSCRLRVRLSTGQKMRVDLPLSEYHRLGLNLGVTVRVMPANRAIRLVHAPTTFPVHQSP